MNEPFLNPSRVIKEKLSDRGLSQKDLAVIIGKSDSYVSDNLAKERITVEFAQELSVVLGETAKYWLDISNTYQLALLGEVSHEVKARNKLLQEYPLKELQKRGWIGKSDDLDEIVPQIDDLIERGRNLSRLALFKRTIKEQELNVPESLWLGRSMKLAELLPVEKYDETKLPSLFSLLRKAAKSSQAVHKVAELLHRYGIRFVINQKLKNAQIDGAAFWLDSNSPVIALSLRFDNIGSFWFALIHELMHIKHKDSFSLDNLHDATTDEIEKERNKEAANFLVPTSELENFIKLTSPYYSKVKINNFANKLQIHPGIIIGQLQKRTEIGFNAHHDAMVGVRQLATKTAFTDGWENPVPQVKK